MTRDEAEEIVMAVEIGFGGHYGITNSQYLQGLAILQVSEEADSFRKEEEKILF